LHAVAFLFEDHLFLWKVFFVPESTRSVYSFGPFRLDPLERQLVKQDRLIALPPKAFDTLLALVERSGHLVTKDQLLRQVWPSTFVEEATLAKNIFTVRKALNGQTNGSPYIETIPKIGYRFVVPVETLSQNGNGTAPTALPDGHDQEKEPISAAAVVAYVGPRRNWLTPVAAIAILAMAAVSYASLRLITEWKHATRTPSHRIQSVAVLPLQNLSGDSSQEYFADGMTDELITMLAELRSVQVTSRTSTSRYRQTSERLSKIADELHVDAIVEGAVLRSGDHVRVTVQLIEGSTDRHLWATSYDRPTSDALALQADIARDVARQIQAEITPPEEARLRIRRHTDPEAQEEYLLGRYYWNRRNSVDLKLAIQHFQKAVSIDNNYAAAYAGLADCYLVLPIFSSEPSRDAMLRGKAAAQQAVRLDDSLGEAHTSLAYALEYDWDFNGSQREYLRALALSPGYATAHHWYGGFLAFMNRQDEALEQYQLAMKLDPLSPVINMEAALPYYYRGQSDEAIRRLREALKIDPTFGTTHGQIGWILEENGDYQGALQEFRKAKKCGLSDAPWIAQGMAWVYARSGDKKQARTYLSQFQSLAKRPGQSAAYVASLFFVLGERNRAIQWYQRSYRQHDSDLIGIGIAPPIAALRDDPRFQELIRRVGLPISHLN
jgi:TolB-like protein/DNA-binding winged helix-turn-helix (wHTH) protein/Flp pilus assembly protein TadD